MISRRLGGDLIVSAIGMGCLPMSRFYGPAPDRTESIRVLNRALDCGITLLDTADAYGWGHNEELLGEALHARRGEYVLATKMGHRRTEAGFELCGQPGYVREACEASLRRLRTDYIDLYFLHRPDPEVPIEETVGAMAGLVEAGKVRHLGLSEVTLPSLEKALGVHPIAALESEYSLWTREPEAEILPACRELGIGFVPFSPLGRGILTGRLASDRRFGKGDMRAKLPRFQGENFTHNLALVAELKAFANDKGCTPGQLALAWLHAQAPFIVPIPGIEKIEYIDENVGAASIQLDAEELAKLSKLVTPGKAAGERYDARSMETLDKR